MRNYFNKIFYIRLTVILISLLFSSCVYFNTFYNTKNSFNQAIEIIDSNSSVIYKENSSIPNAAKKLLYESISYVSHFTLVVLFALKIVLRYSHWYR